VNRWWFLMLLVADVARAEQWLEIEPTDRPITVVATGIISSADTLRFGPPPSRSWRTTITELAREGSRVNAGDVLARFDGSATDDRVRTLSAELNAKRSELESLLKTQASEIEEAKVKLAEAESEAEKAARKSDTDAELYASLEYSKLLEQKRLAADMLEFEQQRVKLAAQVRRAKKAELEADIRRLESELSGAEQELAAFTIKAPRDGLVIIGTDSEGRKLDVNDSVNPGIVVVELADETSLQVQAEVLEFTAASIQVGHPAVTTIDAVGSGQLQGEVTEVGSIVRRQSQFSQAMVRDVEVSLPPSSYANLRPGMSVKLTLVVDTRRNALAIPDSAILYRGGEPGVIVRRGGWTRVVLGPANEGMHMVEQGLEDGDEVAL